MSLRVGSIKNRFAVFDAAGKRVTATFTDKSDAEIRMETLRAQGRTTLRPCITCASEFPSEGPHNRMCNVCRRAGSDMDPSSFQIIRTSGRRG